MPLSIPPATSKDQTLVVRVVVEQPYIDNVATHVTYNGMDHVFGIVWQVGKTQGYLRVPESRVTEEPVAADILDCTEKGVSMPARYTPLTAPRLLPYLIEVREQWSREFDEMAAASTKMVAVALVMSLRTTAAPATTATAAQKSLGTARTSTPNPRAVDPRAPAPTALPRPSTAVTAKPTQAKPTQAKPTQAKPTLAKPNAAGGGGGGRNFVQDLLSIKRQKGLGDIPAGTRAEAETLGRAWVNGKDVKRFDLGDGGFGLTDGTRTFRLQYKPKAGGWKANFQENSFAPGRAKGIEVKNIHMDITDMVAP